MAPSPGAAAGGAQSQAYRDCLAANRVTLPSDGPDMRPDGQGTRPTDGTGARPTDGPDRRPTDGSGTRPTDRERPSGPPPGRPSGTPSDRPDPRATDPARQKADAACASLRPERPEGAPGRPGGPGAPGAPAGSGAPGAPGAPDGGAAPGNPGDSARRAFAGCLKDRGIDVPPGGAAALDRAKPEIAEAVKVCEPLLPTGG